MQLTKHRNGFYHYRFIVSNKLYRGSTNLKNQRDAQTAANEIRKQIVLGNLGILDRGPAPTLREFVEKSFMPYAETRHAAKPKTLEYYHFGAAKLLTSRMAGLRLDEITDRDVAAYIDKHGDMSPSGINQGLRTLRRILHVAHEWGRLARVPKIRTCPGEKQRTRILTPEEERIYLDHATEPWKTMATISVEIGLRPGEIFRLKAQDISLESSMLRVTSGKSKAAQREIPLTEAAWLAIKAWLDSIGNPASGWLFPSPVRKGMPYHQHQVFGWHHAALAASGVESFEPYSLRHTALTRIAEHCRNPFTVAAIAGHSSITITQRYVHPQQAEIREALEAKTGLKIGHAASRDRLKVVGEGKQD